MSENSLQDWPLPGMGDESLSPPQFPDGEGNGVGRKGSRSGRKRKNDDCIAPIPSQALRTIPVTVSLNHNERALFAAAKVVAVLHGEKLEVFDSEPPAALQNGLNTNATTISQDPSPGETSSCTLLPNITPNLNHPEDLDPLTAPAEVSFFPPRLPFKVLSPLCISTISIFWRYTAQQLIDLAKTQPLVVLLIYAFQPLRPSNPYMLFMSAYSKKYGADKPISKKEISQAWKTCTDAQNAGWKLRSMMVTEERNKVYPGVQFRPALEEKKVAIRKALDMVGEIIANGARDGLFQDLIHDLVEVEKAARKKLNESDTMKAASQKRQGAKLALLKENGVPGGGAQSLGAESAAQATIGTTDGAQTTAEEDVETGLTSTKRKRSSGSNVRQRKTARTATVTKASKASSKVASKGKAPQRQVDAEHNELQVSGNVAGDYQAAPTSTAAADNVTPSPAVGQASTPDFDLILQGSSLNMADQAPIPPPTLLGVYAGSSAGGSRPPLVDTWPPNTEGAFPHRNQSSAYGEDMGSTMRWASAQVARASDLYAYNPLLDDERSILPGFLGY